MKMTVLVKVLAMFLLLHGSFASAADMTREDIANDIASTLKIQVIEAVNGTFAECRDKLEVEGLIASYRMKKVVDISFGMAFVILDKSMMQPAAKKLADALFNSDFDDKTLRELADKLSSDPYLYYHVATLKVINAAVKEISLQPNNAVPEQQHQALSTAKNELALVLMELPGAKSGQDTKNCSIKIANQIDDDKAIEIAAFMRSDSYRFMLTSWLSTFPPQK